MSDAHDITIIEHIDDIQVERHIGTLDGRPIVAAGDDVVLYGWCLSTDHRPFTLLVDIADTSIVVDRNVERPDLLARFPDAPILSGFEQRIPLAVARTTTHVEMAFRALVDGASHAIGAPRSFRIAQPPETTGLPLPATTAPGRFRRIASGLADGNADAWRMQRRITDAGALAFEGWLLTPRLTAPSSAYLHIESGGGAVQLPLSLHDDGDATRFARAEQRLAAGFSVVAEPFDFQPGLHHVTVVGTDGDERFRGPTEVFHLVDDGDEVPPNHLTVGTRPPGARAHIEPSGTARGTPIVITGTACDPVTGQGADIYYRVNQLRPARLGAAERNGGNFAGLLDTRDLLPGAHRLQILLKPVYPAFWHLVEQVDIVITER